MRFPRSSGILLHPTSLPGRFGIGDLGPEADRFVDFLASAGQSFWQIMPLGPTDHGGSPYASTSAFAGNLSLISPERLVEHGLLAESALDEMTDRAPGRVDHARAAAEKRRLLEQAFQTFKGRVQGDAGLRRDYETIAESLSGWL